MATETTERSFDELTRGLATGSISRGKALRLMGVALVGGTLASLGIGEASADPPGCKRDGKACKKNSQCCSGTCPNGTCGCDPLGGICDSLATCNNNPNCRCLQTAEDSSLCWNAAAAQLCDAYQTCTTSLGCPTGQLCAVNHCCGSICIPPDQICPP